MPKIDQIKHIALIFVRKSISGGIIGKIFAGVSRYISAGSWSGLRHVPGGIRLFLLNSEK